MTKGIVEIGKEKKGRLPAAPKLLLKFTYEKELFNYLVIKLFYSLTNIL